jgi:hypothetical protein
MQTRPTVLASIALSLVVAAPGAFAQGKGGKPRLVICHAPPGNPDARRTMEIPEAAWAGHEAHGDTLGPCDGHAQRHPREYGSDDEREKRADDRKRRDREGEISDEPDRERRRDRDISDEPDGDGGTSDEPDDDGGISDEPNRDRRRDREREISTESEGDGAEDTGSERGFFRGLQRFFGFGGGEADE